MSWHSITVVPTLACSCGAQWETAKHIVVACPRLQQARRCLYAAASTTDYQVMTSRPRPTTALTACCYSQGHGTLETETVKSQTKFTQKVADLHV